MTQPLCYVAAPYSDPSETIRAWHVARARLLARLALACGYAPIEPHSSIAAGVYGDDGDPEQRARGMAASAAICRGVLATRGAVLWALLRDDQGMSEGTRSEWQIAREAKAVPQGRTWWDWRRTVAAHASDLLPEWDRLATRPDAVGEWEGGDGSSIRDYASGQCAALVLDECWYAYRFDEIIAFAEGPETGALGRAAADAALRRAGVMR